MARRLEAREQLNLARIMFAANPVDKRERAVIRAREEMVKSLQAIADGGIHMHPDATSDTDTIIAFFQNLGGGGTMYSRGIQVDE